MYLWLHVCSCASVVLQSEQLFSFFPAPFPHVPILLACTDSRQPPFWQDSLSSCSLVAFPWLPSPQQHMAHLLQFEFLSDLCCASYSRVKLSSALRVVPVHCTVGIAVVLALFWGGVSNFARYHCS